MTRHLVLVLLAAAAHAQTVQGVTVNKVSGKPVAGADVQLIGIEAESDPDIYRGRSDSAGHFRFDGVVPGRYRAVAESPGYIHMEFAPGSPILTVERSQSSSELTLRMTPACVISGRVADPDGDPIPYASVEALQYGYHDGKKSLRNLSNTRTDDRGEYRLFGLAPGRYYVRAMLRGGPAGAFSPAFYGGGRDPAQARIVEASPAREAQSIDMMLSHDTPHTISGRVVDGETGQLAKNVYVTARTADGFANGGPQLADSFAIHGLPPGKYILIAQEFSGGVSKAGRMSVDLGSADLGGVQLTLVPGVNVQGTVRKGNAPPADAKIHILLEGEDYSGDCEVTPDGTFHFPRVLPGSYRLVWSTPKGVYVKSIRSGDRLLADDRIEITGNPAPIAIQLSDDGGKVAGLVRNGAGEPVAGATVTLTSDPSYDFWSAVSDEKGQFEIRDIAPGEYKLMAFDGAPDGAPQDADFRKQFEKNAVKLQVLPSTQQKADVVAIPGQ